MDALLFSILALDLDGTLLNSQKKISPMTQKTLQQYQNLGGKIILVSERAPQSVAAFARSFHLPGCHLAYNGNAWVDYTDFEQEPQVSFFKSFERTTLDHLWEILGKHPDVQLFLFGADKVYTSSQTPLLSKEKSLLGTYISPEISKKPMIVSYPSEFETSKLDPIFQIVLYAPPACEKVHRFLQKPQGFLPVYSADSSTYEITPIGINKGNSLTLLSDQLLFSMDDTLAFGNGLNDLSLLSAVCRGIAVENAAESLKNMAYGQTESNDNDGIVKGIHLWAIK